MGLLFYMHDGPKTFRFELSGNLSGVEVGKLDQAWRTASSTFGGKVLAVDLTFLNGVDENGRKLLERWSAAGAHFVANSDSSRHLAESITGQPYAPGDPAVGPTFEPRFTAATLRAAAAAAILALTLLFPSTASAGDLNDGSAVLERYSAGLSERGLDTATVTLDVEASLPKFQKQARIQAIRTWEGGKRAYQFTAIEGDGLVRREMIARYFEIDTEKSPLTAPITKSNYRFRFVSNTGSASVFEITPRRKRKGMIAGQMWIDNETGLVTRLTGRMVKSPSAMLRQIGITQQMEIRHGATFARETRLDVDTRFTGRAELTIRERTRTAQEEVTEYVAP